MSVSTASSLASAQGVIRSVLGTLVSFESIFALFIYSGRFKADPRFEAVPVDLTLLFGAASALAAAFLILRGISLNRAQVIAFFLGLLLFGWLIVSTAWSTGGEQAYEKAFWSIPLAMLGYFGSLLIIARDAARVRRFLSFVVAIGAWIGAEALGVMGSAASGPALNMSLMGSNYLGIGRVMALAAIILLAWLWFGRRRPLSELFVYGSVALLLLGILGTGSRQSLVGFALAALFLLANAVVKCRQTRGFAVALAVVVGAICYSSLNTQQVGEAAETFTTWNRVQMLLTGDLGSSAEVRLQYRDASLAGFAASPFVGQGLGSFGARHGNHDSDYPHNILLEVAFEGGLVALALAAALLLGLLRGFTVAPRGQPDWAAAAILGCVIVAGFSMLVSSTYSEDRSFLSLLALLSFRAKEATLQ